ncbi:hypothetical protein LCGC14_1165210 [marine sediment metagenome]|uniref:Uncharacterized protein n=1 Tax=marine sediment metagenome TaxID=412755 RepID=A0A0F9LWC0_9ZZZZ
MTEIHYLRLEKQGLERALEELQKKNDSLQAENKKFKDLEAEGEQILFQQGPIICRNGVRHKRHKGCLYCERDNAEAKSKTEYQRGFTEGVTLYAWWKDGVQYVGCGSRTLEQALKNV